MYRSLTQQVRFHASSCSALLYAAGFLEGALTAPQIWLQWQNIDAWILSQFKGGVVPAPVVEFFSTQDKWSREQVATNASAPLWQLTGLILSQFDGLRAGYAAVAPASEAMTDLGE
jgi:hypothetical protein